MYKKRYFFFMFYSFLIESKFQCKGREQASVSSFVLLALLNRLKLVYELFGQSTKHLFLHRPARKELNVPKQKNTNVLLSQYIYILWMQEIIAQTSASNQICIAMEILICLTTVIQQFSSKTTQQLIIQLVMFYCILMSYTVQVDFMLFLWLLMF